MRMERCQTSRCSDLYDRYIPGYMAPSTSSSSESRDNRQPQIMSTQLSNNVGDNQIEKFITAAHGGDMVIWYDDLSTIFSFFWLIFTNKII